MDNFPKWQKPKWLEQLTPEKIQSMSHEEVYQLLTELLHHTKKLPECPPKKFLVKLGHITLVAQKLKMEAETASEERKKEIGKLISQKLQESIVVLTKLAVMTKAQEYSQEVVEITEEENFDDPWDSSPKEMIIKENEEKEKNKIGEYDPWAIE